MHFFDIFFMLFIIKFVFLLFSFFLWQSIKFLQKNINQSETKNCQWNCMILCKYGPHRDGHGTNWFPRPFSLWEKTFCKPRLIESVTANIMILKLAEKSYVLLKKPCYGFSKQPSVQEICIFYVTSTEDFGFFQ